MQLNHIKRNFRIIGYAMLFSLAIALYPGCGLAAASTPFSSARRTMPGLPQTIFGMATLVFLIVSALLAYSLLNFRHQSPTESEMDHNFQSIWLETIWTIIPVGILIMLLLLTMQTMGL